jgi:flagellar basal-body rod protein FlgB
MFAKLTNGVDFQSKALLLRAERQRILASNIANVDTPGYIARDFDFKAAMADATSTTSLIPSGGGASNTDGTNNKRHIALQLKSASELSGSSSLGYTVQTQPAMDGNSVDLDRERAAFVDNAVRYESTLRFINGSSKTILSAIQGQ